MSRFSRASVLRGFGPRWPKILWKTWLTGTRYDTELHKRNPVNNSSVVVRPSRFLHRNRIRGDWHSFEQCVRAWLNAFAGVGTGSEVFRRQAGALGDSSEHSWANLLAIVEGEHEIGPVGPRQCSV